MADIFHSFPINAAVRDVFEGVSLPKGIDNWWTKTSAGTPLLDEVYALDFGPKYIWNGIVSKCVADREFELTITHADADWIGTQVGFSMQNKNNITAVEFYHKGWPENSEHYRISCYC